VGRWTNTLKWKKQSFSSLHKSKKYNVGKYKEIQDRNTKSNTRKYKKKYKKIQEKIQENTIMKYKDKMGRWTNT
jgi:hypothetical protein